MTTTTHPKLNRIIALRDQANGKGTTEAERSTFMTKARELCEKYGIDTAILTEAPKQTMKRDYIDGSQPQEKRFACRFGCSAWTLHTIDELNACAEKARNANGGNAYAKKTREPFEDLFREWYNQGANPGGHHAHDDHEPKARATGSHANCYHEATKSARAKCRRERGV